MKQEQTLSPFRRNGILLTLLLSSFITAMSTTVTGNMIPNLMVYFSVSSSAAQWLTSGATLLSGIIIPITAVMMKRMPNKLYYLLAMSLFTIGSLGACVATDFPVLLCSRLIQALGCGMLLSFSQIVILTIYPREKHGVMMAAYSMAATVSSTVGPTYAGLLMDSVGWRGVFVSLLIILDTVKELPPYTFIMIALYSGLRREEILGLQWDCVFLDAPAPYISVRRAWRTEHNRPVVSTTLKTKAARRDVPIPKCLVDRLREVKEKSISEYVIADSKGQPLSYSQFQRVWKYVTVRTAKPRNYYKYVNGQSIKYTVTPTLGGHQKNNPKLIYSIDFDVTPHQLRHTYITNLLYAGVDPKTVQYLAGHENSKTTMDIYAQVKYNKPEELVSVVNAALRQ